MYVTGIGILTFVLLYLGYLSSVFSLSVFIDSDQLTQLAQDQKSSRKKFLLELADNPSVFNQIATFYKWSSFVALATLVYFLHQPLAGALGVPALPVYLLALAVATALSFLALEALPRRRSLQSLDERFMRLIPALRIARSLSAFYLRLIGGMALRRQEELSEDVKEDIVERAIETLAEQVGAGEKLVDEEEREMIENIFHLDTTRALEIMTPRVDMVSVAEDASLEQVRSIAREKGHSRLPVVRKARSEVIGVLYLKDIFSNPPKGPDSFNVPDYMRNPFFVPAEMPLDNLLAKFRSERTHLAIVIDEYGGAAGVVSLEDVLEVIVGDIQDEHDEEEAEFLDLGNGLYEIDSALSVEELVERLNLKRERREFETVASLIYNLVGAVPSEGAEVRWEDDVEFIVTQLDGQRIDRVKVRHTPRGTS